MVVESCVDTVCELDCVVVVVEVDVWLTGDFDVGVAGTGLGRGAKSMRNRPDT